MNKLHFATTTLAAAVLAGCGTPTTEVPSSPSSSSSSFSSSASSISNPSPGIPQGPGVDVNTDLPREMRISDDAERLEMGGFYQSKFFNDSEIETVYLEFAQGDFKQQLANNKENGELVEATLTYKGEVFEQVGVRYRGMTSYSMAGDKKSLSIDLDWQIDGQDINGFNSFKLNNGYEDTSNMREVLFNNLTIRNITSAKASFAHVVINGEDFGVFAKVQKLNKDHVKEWYFDKDNTRWRAEQAGGFSFGGGGGGGGFGGGGFDFGGGGFGGGGFGGGGGGFGSIFGAGTSSLNDLGPNGSDYQEAYNLKNTDVDSWQDLANAAHTMGTVAANSLVEELGQYLDIDAALWMIATENLFTDDDSYINKGGLDYYVYFDLETQRIIPIEYDGNSVLGASHVSSWTPFYNEDNASFALMNILLKIPELRQRYLAHYRTLIEEELNPNEIEAKIDAYASLIENFVSQADVTQYSYNQYVSGVQELKQAVRDRHNFVSNYSEVNRPSPSISNVVDSVDGYESVRPGDNQSVLVSAQISSSNGIRQAYLYYGTGLAGRFQKIPMSSNGSTYTATIPAMPRGEYVRYYIEAIANDGNNTASYSPKGAEHDVYIYQVKAADKVDSPVVINELMADNESVVTTPEGEFSDWVELYNNSDSPVDLSGYYLTDEDSKLDRWSFPNGTTIGARDTLIVWLDDDEDLVTALHANFNLSAGGESLYLVTPGLQFADLVTFDDAPEDQSYSRTPNGTGNFQWTSQTTFDSAN